MCLDPFAAESIAVFIAVPRYHFGRMVVTGPGSTALFELLEHRRLLAQTPFYGSPLQIPGTVQAEDFDFGGESVAYHDTTVENLGGSDYHGVTGVDLHA